MLLGLEPVSKYRKEQHLQSKKLGQSKCRNITIQAPKGYTLK